MKIAFTLCSNNYLAQALVLSASFRKHQPDWQFMIGLVDKKIESISYEHFGVEVVEISQVEPGMTRLAEKFSLVELNTCVKPTFFQYLFEKRNAQQVVYLDPDISLYGPMDELEKHFITNDFILTPHILTPIPLDQCTPGEPLFLNYGLYNLGFLALNKTAETGHFLSWWKERTYELGYDQPGRGLFTDQLWINLVPLYFDKVTILRHAGYNMAPWNLHERQLDEKNIINGQVPLVFYHFSGFDPAKQKLHKDYTRYPLSERADLLSLYLDYKTRLEQENYYGYKRIPCFYASLRTAFLQRQSATQQQEEARRYANLPFYRKCFRHIKRLLPVRLKKMALQVIRP